MPVCYLKSSSFEPCRQTLSFVTFEELTQQGVCIGHAMHGIGRFALVSELYIGAELEVALSKSQNGTDDWYWRHRGLS